MLKRVGFVFILISCLGRVSAQAAPSCLPPSLFTKGEASTPPTFDLGLVAGVPTICASMTRSDPMRCWAVDPANGTLSATVATSLPWHARKGMLDANRCLDGYCLSKPSEPKETEERTGEQTEAAFLVASTTGTKVAILSGRLIHIFDRETRKQLQTIPLYDEAAPGYTNVSNEPVKVFYVGDIVYVVGSDAGPYIAVWRFRDDGTRLGVVTSTGKADDASFSVFNGGVNVLDDDRIMVADAALQRVRILSSKNEKNRERTRPSNLRPCTAVEVESALLLGDIESLSARCKATVKASLEPFFDVIPIELSSGDVLAALSGKYSGSLSLLDGKTLKEKKRFKLLRCPK